MRVFRIAATGVVAVGLIVAGALCQTVEAAGKNNKQQGAGNRQPGAGNVAAQNAQNRQMQIAAIRAQVAAAQQVLAQAKSQASVSSAELDKARKRLEEARTTIAAADSEQQTLRKTLDGIEDDLLEAQPDDSKVGLARDTYQAAKEKVDAELKRLQESPAYVSRLKAIEQSPDPGPARLEFKKNALADDTDYQTALQTLQDAKKKFDKLKADLFAKDSGWAETNSALLASEAAEREARAKGGVGRLGAAREVHNAKQLIAAAQATIADGNAALQALGANNNQPGKGKGKRR